MLTRYRRPLIFSAIALALILALIAAAFQVSRAKCWQLIGTPLCHIDTSERLVALTFDDGPTPKGVDAILPILQRYDAHATFFLIGGDLAKNPGQARRLLADGHEIGNHSYSHQRMWGLFPGAYEQEIRRTDALLRAEGAANPTLFRPPYGKKLTGLPLAVQRTGYRTIMWDVEDPAGAATPKDYADRMLAEVRPGSIILIHAMYSGGQVARDALPLILEGLKQRGYRVVTVSALSKR